MFKRWRLSWVDIVLVVILVVGTAIVFPLSQSNTSTAQEKVRLETSLRAAGLNLSEAERETDLEGLRQSLEQARSALAQSPFLREVEAIAVTDKLQQYAEENNITIASWDSGYTSISLRGREYAAISHSLSTAGKSGDLVSFMEALTQASVASVVQSIDITGVEGQQDSWQMMLELLVYYR